MGRRAARNFPSARNVRQVGDCRIFIVHWLVKFGVAMSALSERLSQAVTSLNMRADGCNNTCRPQSNAR